MRFISENEFCSDKRVLIFGRGQIAESFLNAFPIPTESVIGFVESKKSADRVTGGGGELSRFTGKPIFSVNDLPNIEFDLIFIANQHPQTLEQTIDAGISIEKIRIASQNLLEKFVDRKIKFAIPSVMTQKNHIIKISEAKIVEDNGNFFLSAMDSIRFQTMKFLAQEIRNQNIQGEIAELGVYRGEFARYLNSEFPDRTLNLFDTFEGFAESDEQNDLKANLVSDRVIHDTKFIDTSIDLVMSKMKYPERVKIYQGYFPETIPSEEKRFALVSLDTDIYPPMLAGFEYFYPRLSEGGFIMAHDYNSANFFDSVHKAVDDFEKKFGHIAKIPIADENGTLIITK